MDAVNPSLTFYPTCPMRILIFLVAAVGGLFPADAAVTATRGGAALASRNYPSSTSTLLPVTINVAAEVGFTITATLDGDPLPVGSTVVSRTGYHEIHETKVNQSTNVASTVLSFQFIINSPGRGSSETGLPAMEPYRIVNDAPAAFAGQHFKVIAPRRFPLNLPVPVALRLTKGASAGVAAGDPLFLNGVASAANYPTRPIQLRRGWGSTILPPANSPGHRDFAATLNGLAHTAPIQYEAATTWTAATGNLTGASNWPADSRIHLLAVLTIKAGASLTVGPGTVIRAAPGAEIWVEPGGTVNFNGTTTDPIVIVPDQTGVPWGGIWLHQATGAATAQFTATSTLFCCWGANQSWYSQSGIQPSRSIFSRHRQQQPCIAIGTSAVCRLTDCALIGPITRGELRGAGFATRDGQLHLDATSMQRVITGGEQEGGTVEIHRSALLECNEPNTDPDDGTAFDDEDNDGIYLVPGSGNHYHISKTVIGWTKDDGIDSGGSGSGSVTAEDCWFENCVHEAFSNSGSGRQPTTRRSVHFNCGQGMECGYGDGGNGPQSLVDQCLLTGNMTGARYGDNYQFSNYEGTLTVQNSLLLYNLFRDSWAIEWRNASNWNHQDTRLVAKGTKISRATDLARQQGPEDTPSNDLWNPASDGPLISPFMPVPDAPAGLALLHPELTSPLADYPANGDFTIRLSTFNSRSVRVPWQVTGKAGLDEPAEVIIATGTALWLPGETLKTFSSPLPAGHAFGVVHVALGTPVNGTNTGQDAWFFKNTEPALAKASNGWSYYANRTPAAALQKPPNDASNRRWFEKSYLPDTNWKTGRSAPLGWGTLGAASPGLILATTLATGEQGITAYFRRTFNISDPAAVRALNMEVLSDDGMIAFINGIPFPAINVDPGNAPGDLSNTSSDRLATSTKGDGNAEVTYDRLTAPGSILAALLPGENILAIEVHQASATSSDMVCDAALTLTLAPPGSNDISIFAMENRLWLYWDEPSRIMETSPDLGQWVPQPGATSPYPLNIITPRGFFRVR